MAVIEGHYYAFMNASSYEYDSAIPLPSILRMEPPFTIDSIDFHISFPPMLRPEYHSVSYAAFFSLQIRHTPKDTLPLMVYATLPFTPSSLILRFVILPFFAVIVSPLMIAPSVDTLRRISPAIISADAVSTFHKILPLFRRCYDISYISPPIYRYADIYFLRLFERHTFFLISYC
jgi:hypothetical protein